MCILFDGKFVFVIIILDVDIVLMIEVDVGVFVGSFEIEIVVGVLVIVNEVYSIVVDVFLNICLEILLGECVIFECVIWSDVLMEVVFVVCSCICVVRNVIYKQVMLMFGFKFFCYEIYIIYVGEGVEVYFGGVYLLEEGCYVDFIFIVIYMGLGGVMYQLIKGVVMVYVQGVFQGKFKVEQVVQQIDVKMIYCVLMLDEWVEIDVKFELEIYVDDVQCVYGNVLGVIDEIVLFYMCQCGLFEIKVCVMLIESFFVEFFDIILDEVFCEEVLDLLCKCLGEIV